MASPDETYGGQFAGELDELLEESSWRRLSFHLQVDDYGGLDAATSTPHAATFVPEAPPHVDGNYHPQGPFAGAQRRTSRSIELDNPYIHRRYASGPYVAPADLVGLPSEGTQLGVQPSFVTELHRPVPSPERTDMRPSQAPPPPRVVELEQHALSTLAAPPPTGALGPAGLMELTIDNGGGAAPRPAPASQAAAPIAAAARQRTVECMDAEVAPMPAQSLSAVAARRAPAWPTPVGREQGPLHTPPPPAPNPLPAAGPPPAVGGPVQNFAGFASMPVDLTHPAIWPSYGWPGPMPAAMPQTYPASAWLDASQGHFWPPAEAQRSLLPAAYSYVESQPTAPAPAFAAEQPTPLLPSPSHPVDQAAPALHRRTSCVGQPTLATISEAAEVEPGPYGPALPPGTLPAFAGPSRAKGAPVAQAVPAASTPPGARPQAPRDGYFALPIEPARPMAPLPTTPRASTLHATPPTTPGRPPTGGTSARTPGKGGSPQTPQKRRGDVSPSTTPRATKPRSQAAGSPGKRARTMSGSAPSSPGPRTENAATLERSPTSEPAQGLAPAWSPSLSVSPGGRAFMVLPPSPPKSVRAPQPASAIATSAGSASTSPKRKRNERAPRAHGPAEPAELAELAVSTEAQAHRGPSVLQLSPLILAPVAPLGREEEVERERRAPLMTELTWVRLEGGAAIALAPNGPKAAFAVSRAQVAACYDNVHLEAGLRSIDRNAETVAYYLARPQALNAWLAQAHLHGIRLVNANDFLRSHFAKVSIFLDA